MSGSETCPGRGRFTIKQKREILEKVEQLRKAGKVSMKQISSALNLSRSTLLSIISKRKLIETAPESEQDRYRARNIRANPNRGKVKYLHIEKALSIWIDEQKLAKKRILGSIIRKKALAIAKDLGYKDFTASNGWCDRFKKKFHLEFKKKENICPHPPEPDKAHANIAPEDYLDIIDTENCNTMGKSTVQQFEMVSKNLRTWVSLIESKGGKVTGKLLKEMAFALAAAIGVAAFTGSNGWLHNFQLRSTKLRLSTCPICNPRLPQSKA